MYLKLEKKSNLEEEEKKELEIFNSFIGSPKKKIYFVLYSGFI